MQAAERFVAVIKDLIVTPKGPCSYSIGFYGLGFRVVVQYIRWAPRRSTYLNGF